MAKEMIINVTVPEGYSAGDTFQVKVLKSSRTREAKDINDMTVDELKKEIRNAKSCVYKATQHGRDASKVEERLAAAEQLLQTKYPEAVEPKKEGGATVYSSVVVE